MKRMRCVALIWLGALGLITTAKLIAANDRDTRSPSMSSIRVRVGEKVFAARLADNAAATAFAAMLPLTLTMRDLNDNEKVADLPQSLPGKPSNPGTISTGDLMLWSSRSFVLFYKTFPTSYSYVRLGRIEDTTGLAEAVGAGSITITFEKP